MSLPRIAILHYSVAPTVGGVEAVISAHAALFAGYGYPVSVIAGRGAPEAFLGQIDFVNIPEMDSQHPKIAALSPSLEAGQVPEDFEQVSGKLQAQLERVLEPAEIIILHNLFSKHFNFPLTVALWRLLTQYPAKNWISWSHDFTWTSQRSRRKVHPGFPWDLLRTYIPEVTYVTVSKARKEELVTLLACTAERIHVIYNGVHPADLLGLSNEGDALAHRMDLFTGDLILLMPVRVTRAKNIEMALHIVAELKARGANPRLVVTGPPDPYDENSVGYFKQLQRLRSQLGLSRELRFVWESGPEPDQPYQIGPRLVGDLLRICDVMLMSSHYEGFGMPVLEAGLVGAMVVSTPVPASLEIAGEDCILFETDDSPQSVARKIIDWSLANPHFQLRKKVRQRYTWNVIFERDIRPLFESGD